MADGQASNVAVQNTSLGRMNQLVNNDFLSDVTFLVGKPGQIMYGHKVFLSLASGVLNTLFDGHLVEGQRQIITVPDIEAPTFGAILRFIYCEDVTLTKDNVVDIYYAANKYMLSLLEMRCETFLQNNIDESNVLNIFSANRRYEFEVVNKVCLDLICDNPLECFKHDLLSMDQASLEMVAQCTPINCLREQLLEAMQKWLENKNSSNEDASGLLNLVPQQHTWLFKCKKMLCFGNIDYATEVRTNVDLQIKKPGQLSLYGLGIWIGTETPCTGNNLVKLEIKINSRIITNTTVPLKAELYIKEVMFEKETITESTPCQITVNLEAKNKLFFFTSFVPAQSFGPEKVTNTFSYGYDQDYYDDESCLAHIYYNRS